MEDNRNIVVFFKDISVETSIDYGHGHPRDFQIAKKDICFYFRIPQNYDVLTLERLQNASIEKIRDSVSKYEFLIMQGEEKEVTFRGSDGKWLTEQYEKPSYRFSSGRTWILRFVVNYDSDKSTEYDIPEPTEYCSNEESEFLDVLIDIFGKVNHDAIDVYCLIELKELLELRPGLFAPGSKHLQWKTEVLDPYLALSNYVKSNPVPEYMKNRVKRLLSFSLEEYSINDFRRMISEIMTFLGLDPLPYDKSGAVRKVSNIAICSKEYYEQIENAYGSLRVIFEQKRNKLSEQEGRQLDDLMTKLQEAGNEYACEGKGSIQNLRARISELLVLLGEKPL